MNALTISSIIACIGSVLLAVFAVARVLVKHVFSGSVPLLVFGRSNWVFCFGAIERRVLGLSFALFLCSILNFIVSSRVGNSECDSEMARSSVLPILLCLESVAIPMCHLIFVLPSIVESMRTPALRFDSKLSDMHSDNRLILSILKFAAKVIVFAGSVILFWLPVYLLYTNDSSAVGTCFAQSGSMLWYMGSKTAIAGSAVAICLIALLVSGMMAVLAYSMLRRTRSRKMGYRLVAYLYVIVATVCTALTLPELVYHARREQYSASDEIPDLLKYLTIASLPAHALLLCLVTILAYLFMPSKELDYGVFAADNIVDEIPDQGHFSLSFYASPRYEDKYLSVMNPGALQDPRVPESMKIALTATSTASSLQMYEQAETESMHDSHSLQVQGFDRTHIMPRDIMSPFRPIPYYAPAPQTDTPVLPEKNLHRFNFL
ncbi:hypothetical protein POJ06DRAFT_64367 [Lipomyces tetrasporus]|uniref:Uncharacterized protein n=1 Tax=Lipomyces tetrasporus TaxID=54092 RepID=A0AAD7QXK2_9ASCO|nr:uncharacterized protein POJ06DRAFT_64367 [Lipomyces tetrasporus]KAJ8103158.1 hypothetical protein POJ06DRAFT_64367 [Lipomyces tetrasporus]